MRWSDLLLISVQNLWRRKLRTVLTMVGVMIGTASIVVMVSMGIGINQGYIDSLSETGELTRIEINSQLYWSDNSNAVVYLEDDTTVKAQKLDDTMLRKIAALDHVQAVTPIMDLWNFSVETGKLESYYGLRAIAPEAVTTLNMEFVEGGGFSQNGSGDTIELLLGEGTLYSFRNPKSQIWDSNVPDVDWLNDKFTVVLKDYNDVDEDYNPKEYEFKARVVGIVKDTGSDTAYNIYVNYDTMKRIIQKHKNVFKNSDVKTDQYQMGYVKVDDFNNALEVQNKIKELGIDAWSYAQMIESMQEQSRSLQLMLGGIGAVAMLVAAISIANTMLMSIYERTREIGVMKVLGCRMSSIGAMFLCEAAIIGLIGGLVGLGLSYGIGAAVNLVMGASGAYGSFRSVIPLWLALVGVEGKDVLIADDILATGDSMLDVARELKRRKCGRIFMATTFALFTNGVEVFHKAHEEGLFDYVLATNLNYLKPELKSEPWFIEVDMSKYIALLVATLNHDRSISPLLNPLQRIQKLLANHRANQIAQER